MVKLKTFIVGLAALSLFIAPVAGAISPGDFGLKEGNLIRGEGTLDVFIINEFGYKRLFLNPEIFEMYGHLGGWGDVKTVPVSTVNAFETSPYYRADGDTKVYQVEVTGEDTGIFHWVNVSQEEFLANVDANSIFTINALELAWYPKGDDVTSFGPAAGAPVGNVMLASDNPAGRTVTQNAQGVTFLKVTSNVAVDSLKLKHKGFGSQYELDEVYVVNNNGLRVSSERSFNSDREVTFRNLGLGTGTFSVVANLDATSGNEHRLELVEVNSTVLSGLPLLGNVMRVSGAYSGELSVTNSGSLDPIVIGQANAQLAEFRLTVDSTEDVLVKRLQMLQTGNVDLSNLKLVVNNKTFNGTINSKDEIVFDLGSGLLIKKDKSDRFKVYGDIDQDARSGQTVTLDFELDSDVVAVGQTYGFGVGVDLSFGAVTLVLSDSGDLSVKARSIDDQRAYWGQVVNNLAQFRFSASEEEAFYLDELEFSGSDMFVNVDEVTISYKNKAGDTLTATESVDSDDTVTFTFSGVNRPYVPADGDLDVMLGLMLVDEDEDLTRLDDWRITLDRYEAVGASSDEELEEWPGVTSKDGLWTSAGYFKVSGVNAGTALSPSQYVMFKLTAKVDNSYTLALTDANEVNLEVRYKNYVGSLFEDIKWTAYVNNKKVDEGYLPTATDSMATETITIDFSDASFDDLEFSNGDVANFEIRFSEDFSSFDYQGSSLFGGDRFSVELLDSSGVFTWMDAFEDDDHEANIGYIEDLDSALPLLWSYRN